MRISEAGVYAYLAICSLSLPELFPVEWNTEFNRQYVKSLCRHLRANDRVETVMLVLVEGKSGQTPDLYINLLMEESGLAGKPIIIIQDAVLFAVRKGNEKTHFYKFLRHNF